ncbi:MAG: MAC/perforin domain-containing protein [Pseudomonadota bacterium]
MIGSAVFAITNPSASAQATQPGAMPGLASDELFQGPVKRKGRPIEAFKGCKIPERLQATSPGSADRLRSRNASTDDPTTARVFASLPLSDGIVSDEDLNEDCRYRLDGIWVQDTELSLDEGRAPRGFGGLGGRQVNSRLTHANFTTPDLMYVSMADDGSSVSIRRATHGREPITLYAVDRVPMRDVMRPSGTSKRYVYREGTGRWKNATLTVSVSRTGRPELRWQGYSYNRPEPTVAGAQNVDINDVFLIGNNLDNYRASLRGYDVIGQDPFELNRNSKAQIFANSDPRDFAIVEKRTVPLGLKYIPEGVQGSVTSREMIASQYGFQRASASSFGVNIGFEKKDKDTGESIGSLGAGASYAKTSTIGRQLGMQRAVSMGFARHKVYTLVLDRPFSKLSDEFIDAVDFAYRMGRYDDLIDKFGTHYPYAVTYGSQARFWTSFDQKTIRQWQSKSENINANAGGSLLGFSIGTSASSFVEESRDSSRMSETAQADFEAVGGTGSFDQGGFGTGTPVPILTDLRPITDLLNPLYFPDEPEIWSTVRARLDAAIEQRLARAANRAGLASVVPEYTRPKPGLIKNITIQTHTGSRENVRVAFGRNRFSDGKVRVCFKNFKSGTRAMSHGVRGVNPFRVVGKGQSCATIGANQKLRLKFSAADREGSKILGEATFDLAPYDAGYVDFLYGVGP